MRGMGLFDDRLTADQSLIRNEASLDFEFVPKEMPYRENQHHYIAECIKPLLSGRTGRNLFISGSPGIGKTAAVKSVLRELEEETDEIIPIYINCWQKNTTYKVVLAICEELNYRFTQNKKTEELFKVAKGILNKQGAVFCFDEVDKLEDLDFLYTVLEEVYKKTVILITNYREWLITLDSRIKSRLNPDQIHFEAYSLEETKGILRQRIKYAFLPGAWDEDALSLVAQKAFGLKDIRQGIYLLRESGLAAEAESSKAVKAEHAKKAIAKIDKFEAKDPEDLEEDTRLVLDIIKANSGKKIGDLYEAYKKAGGDKTYKTFQRKIEKLEQGKFITTKKTTGGPEGNTTFVSAEKTLDEFR